MRIAVCANREVGRLAIEQQRMLSVTPSTLDGAQFHDREPSQHSGASIYKGLYVHSAGALAGHFVFNLK